MMLLKWLLSLFLVCFLLGCKATKGNFNQSDFYINILDYGAVVNDNLDDSKAFIEVFELIKRTPGNYIISLPKGIIIIEKPIVAPDLTGFIYLKGEEGTIINVKGPSFGSFKAKSHLFHLVKDIQHDDSSFKISSVDKIKFEKNDLIHVQSNSVFETAWKYKENDVHRIIDVRKGDVYLKSKFLFNYNLNEEKINATIYKNCLIKLTDIEFRLGTDNEKKSSGKRRTLAAFWGLSLEFDKIKIIYNGNFPYYHNGFSVLASESVSLTNLYLKGLMYGVLLNFSRNIFAKNTVAENCRHAYTPSQACVNVSISEISGSLCNSVIDSHCSFNVHYKNVKDTLALEFPNCRALGTFIENATFSVKKGSKQDVCYWSIQSLTPEYQFLYGKYDTKFKNVRWLSDNPSNLNGLTSFSCRNLIVESCITHNIAYYGDEKWLNKIYIKNSQVGMLHSDSQKLGVDSTIFDGALFQEAPYVIKLRGAGKAYFNEIDIINYNPSNSYLFGYFVNKPDNQGIIFNKVRIGKLKGWVNKFIYPGLPFKQLQISNSVISVFKEKIPNEFQYNSKVIEKQIKN